MRERRKQADMTVRELQRQRGVAPVESTASWWLDACYRQLSTQITSLPSTGFQVLQSLTNLLAVDLGPQGCEAAPVVRTASALDDFQQKFSTDFEIWLSPSARRSEDMKGMVIVIGEHHNAPEIQAMVKRVMMGFRQSRGDRFFIEGGDLKLCAERVLKYSMDLSDCRLMERDFAEYFKLMKNIDEALRRLGLCVEYLRAHVPAAREGAGAKNILAYTGFIQRHSSQLPPAAISGFNLLVQATNDAMDLAEMSIAQKLPERDKQMAGVVRTERSVSARNYMVVGAQHAQGIRELLQDLPCVVMVPRQMVAENPALRLQGASRQEL